MRTGGASDRARMSQQGKQHAAPEVHTRSRPEHPQHARAISHTTLTRASQALSRTSPRSQMPETSSKAVVARPSGEPPRPAESQQQHRRDAAAVALFALADTVAPPAAAPVSMPVHASPRVAVPLMATKLPRESLAAASAGAPRNAPPRAVVCNRPSSSALRPAAAAAPAALAAGNGHAPPVLAAPAASCGPAPPAPMASAASCAGRTNEAPPRPSLPDTKAPQEKLALQTVWSASGAAVSAASGLLAFTGGSAGQPATQPQPVVRDFWSANAAADPAASGAAGPLPAGQSIGSAPSVWRTMPRGRRGAPPRSRRPRSADGSASWRWRGTATERGASSFQISASWRTRPHDRLYSVCMK